VDRDAVKYVSYLSSGRAYGAHAVDID
jgi:hypothetical protein